MLKDIAFTAYPSNDVAATRAWYEKGLGLVFTGPYCEDGIEKYNEARFASGCFSLWPPSGSGATPGAAAGVVFEIDDIESAVRVLRTSDVLVEDISRARSAHRRPFAIQRQQSNESPENAKR